MSYVQLVDVFDSGGGVGKFIYMIVQKLAEHQVSSHVAAVHVDKNHHWGDGEISYQELERENDRVAAEQVLALNPVSVIWHVSTLTVGVAAILSRKVPVYAVVHNHICPSGLRLFRDCDQVCAKTPGPACLFNWYYRRCGSGASPVKFAEGYAAHVKIRNALNKCRMVYTVSESMRRYLQLDGVSKEKIKVIDVTLGTISTPLLQEMEFLPRERVDLLFVGRLAYGKGVQYLIRAVHLLKEEDLDFHCTIVGEGYYKQELLKLTEELGIADRVEFAGKVSASQVGERYRGADLVVIPSIYPEPAGLVVPEGRSYGKPVIIFGVGGIAEWESLMDGVFPVKEVDPRKLAEMIREVAWGRRKSSQSASETRRADIIREIAAGFA